MRTIIALFCLQILFTSVCAQVPDFQSYVLGKKHESIQINRIFQDSRGYMWFGTDNGLFRFDGKVTIQFTANQDSLPSDKVTAIAEDSLGQIWTGHHNGKIGIYDGERFRGFIPEQGPATEGVSDILFDAHGILWFGTYNDGLYYYSKERLYRLDEQDGMPDIYVYDLSMDHEGDVWVGTDRGIAVCKLVDGRPILTVLNSRNGLQDDIIRKIVHQGHIVFLGTEDSGLISYDRLEKRFTELFTQWKSGSITDIVARRNKLWISTSKPGLIIMDVSTGTFKYYNESTGSTLESMRTLFSDKHDNVWTGSKEGVKRTAGDNLERIIIDNDGQQNTLSVVEDLNGVIWYSTSEGLFKVRPGSVNSESVFFNKPNENSRIISLYCDPMNYIWAGLYGEGVLRIHTRTGRVTHYRNEIRNGNVLNITGRGNTVWLATLGGGERAVINKDQVTFTNYNSENGLSSDFIYQVFEDSKGRVWFATDGKGVDMLDEKGFHHLEEGLRSKVIYGFAEARDGSIWVNAQDEGLHVFENGKFTSILIDELTSSVSHTYLRSYASQALATDRNGNLVLVHNGGVDLFDPVKKMAFALAGESLIDGEVNLNAVSTTAAGDILFGTEGGIVKYNFYDSINSSGPLPVIHGIKIHGSRIDSGSIESLAYNQNNVTIEFAGFWYAAPMDVRYKYQLTNYDEGLITTSDNSVTYSQLPPGEYEFLVWPSVGNYFNFQNKASVRFIIHPPFWKTTTFYVLVVILVIGVSYTLVKFRERKLKEEKAALEAKVEERTREIQLKTEEIQAQNEEILAQAEEIKGINENLEMLVLQRTAELEKKNKALEEYAFINAHKLRSPVASILGLVNLLCKTSLTDEAKVINTHLQQAAEELDEIVRSITKAIERGERVE